MDYNELGKQILKDVGGPSNVKSITHCVTRVRFVLNDESKADDNSVKNLNGVLQLVKQGGQYQVVIGPSVEKVYDAILKAGNFPDSVIGGGNSQAATSKEEEKGWFSKALGLVASLFTPVLGLLCGAGMIKAVLSVLQVTHCISSTSGTYMLLNALGDSVFYFFPVIIGWSAAKKFGMPQSYGIILGAVLIYPTIVAAASASGLHTVFANTIFALKYKDTFLGIPIALQNYSSSVVPIIIIVWLSSYVYKWFKKVIPDVLKMVFVPFLTLLVCGVLGVMVIGPIAMILQNMLSGLVLWLVSISKGLTGFVIGSTWFNLVNPGYVWIALGCYPILCN